MGWVNTNPGFAKLFRKDFVPQGVRKISIVIDRGAEVPRPGQNSRLDGILGGNRGGHFFDFVRNFLPGYALLKSSCFQPRQGAGK
ncbi:MAG: hypothetical protein EOQ50_09515 [Mesorhizobium sp.]|uniref:hypothetical protein n=1 Tax=Mesorhizobium sp. TaxID=1871066 RepID=UPI000FE7CD8C|nr:hypothetical protein [Mesorhizobium sp.]RWB77143.1 MAG: hypothetical protein EOQ50_09515 [Mesorhizobium sp.]RWL96783.1 MAG: hypothetical protein EOR68_18115 [Mesorhizobium sp.]TIP04156.1 MAG: hypothetical protein E5X72_12535 [Mesorhizobium sp.]TIP41529.1 MAG: hypothetical protein E5X77_25775 [Mesorhizobium sp.]